MSQNIQLDKRPVSSPAPLYSQPSVYMYGSQHQHQRQESLQPKALYHSSPYGLMQQDLPSYYVRPEHMRQSPQPMLMQVHNQHMQQHQQYLQPLQDPSSHYGRDSVSPVQMSLSPEPASSLPELTLQGTQGTTPTRSSFNLVAPAPRLPSVMRRPLLDKATPASSDDGHGAPQDEDDSQREETVADVLDRTVQARDYRQHHQSSDMQGGRQLRRGRSGQDSLSMSGLSLASMSPPTMNMPSHVYTQSDMHPQQSHQAGGIALPTKIKSLGTLPADEAFSSSLDQLDDVPHGTKPPYLWWTLIRATILGAPGQTLQMETLTQLIQQKYP